MNFLATLESTAFSEWVLTSMLGFPTLIALHSVGMAIAAGLSIFVSLYLNGLLSRLAQEHLPRLLRLAMLGFFLNLVTGLALFVSRGADYITNVTFLIKMSLVLISAISLGWLRHHLMELLTSSVNLYEDSLSRRVSLISIATWVGAIIAGRLIAYVGTLY
ncbi:MAG: hypothetical protein P8J68_12080 [Arenicellaceae bacterium]|nr:hypothetical protein [Arenicellaceae bacterium]